MIGLIQMFLYNLSKSKLITTAHNKWLPKTRSILVLSLFLRLISEPEPESESYITTDGQSGSLSWCRAPSGAYDQIFIAVW
jgi:hypothetical protein